MKEKSSCDNKKELYICKDTPAGKECTPVEKAPQCFKRSVTFFE